MRGSLAMTNSHARSVASSKSGESAGRICQPVTSFPSTPIDRREGKSARKLSWCSTVVASQTPLSAGAEDGRAESARFFLSYEPLPYEPRAYEHRAHKQRGSQTSDSSAARQ